MNKWLLLLGLLIVIGGTGTAVYMKTRGIRNNNPGNIRHGDKWQGMSATQTDAAFVQFDSPVYGIRALNRVLKSYATRHHLATVYQIINRWAPDSENNTEAYVGSVAQSLGVLPHETIDVRQYAEQLTRAIIYHENGLQPYDIATINQGVQLGWA